MSITLELTPAGTLRASLPHEDGTTLSVVLPKGYTPEGESKALLAILRVLKAQLAVPKLTGTASAPTQWQVLRDTLAQSERGRTVARSARVLAEHGGVVIRVIPAKSRKIAKRQISLEELGL